MAEVEARIVVQNGGVTRRGVIDVDLATLDSWPTPSSGTGRFVWGARWMRGPIHDRAWQIVLTVPGSRERNAHALVQALHEYAGIHESR